MMQSLELKLPPPIVALIIAGIMWAVAPVTPSFGMFTSLQGLLAMVIALLGVSISIAGVVAFRRANTTIDPLKPEKTTALVTAGIYQLTRNPMYLGVLLVLVAWAVFLSSWWVLPGPLGFIAWITRFQIYPEERTLAQLFGADFNRYRAQVRRWL